MLFDDDIKLQIISGDTYKNVVYEGTMSGKIYEGQLMPAVHFAFILSVLCYVLRLLKK